MAPLSQNSKQHRLSNLGEEFCTATAKFFHIGFPLNWSTRSVHSFRKLYYSSELSHQISLLLNVVHLYKISNKGLNLFYNQLTCGLSVLNDDGQQL